MAAMRQDSYRWYGQGLKRRRFYDESVRALRAQLRAEFEALLLDDYGYAQVSADDCSATLCDS